MPPAPVLPSTSQNARDGAVVVRSVDERGPYTEQVVPWFTCSSCHRQTMSGLCGCEHQDPVQTGEVPYRVYDADVEASLRDLAEFERKRQERAARHWIPRWLGRKAA